MDDLNNAEDFAKKAASVLFHPDNVMNQNVGGLSGKGPACSVKLRSIAQELRRLFKETMRDVPLNTKSFGLPATVASAINAHFRHIRSNIGIFLLFLHVLLFGSSVFSR